MAKKKDSFGDSPVGSGGRFAECVRTMRRRKNVEDPEGLCASIGRKKYGKRRFQKMASKGRKAAGNPFVPDWQVRQIAKHIAENTMMFVLPSDTRAIAEAAAEELWEITGERPRRSLVLHVVKLARYYYEALKRSTKRHHMEDNPTSGEEAARELLFQASGAMALAMSRLRMAGREDLRRLVDPAREQILQIADSLYDAPGSNPLSDAEHQEADRRAHGLANRMGSLAYREHKRENYDGQNHWEDMASHMRGAAWAHNRAARGDVFPSDLYARTSGLEDYEHELNSLEQIEAGPVANPIKKDGKWHRSEFMGQKTHYLATAKGSALALPYQPRKHAYSANMAALFESEHGQKVPKGTKYLLSIEPTKQISAHKTLDGAKRAGENALRRLPMPNPAPRLVNEGLLAGSRPIPSGLDSPRYDEGILAGSRPIPSGLDSPRVNVGIVDPPITRRSKPEQPF